jgi:RimJ/RimL family protein N-acetyltransferase
MSAGWPAELAPELVGELVVMEPAAEHHREPLRAAAVAGGEDTFRWIGEHYALDDRLWAEYFDEMLEASAAGTEAAFVTCDAVTREPIGSSRYLVIRPVDRALEIGHTWLTRPRWRTGANQEAKLLMLGHAFDDLGCVRVELKTDSRNHRSRTAMLGIGARFEGIHRKHRIVPRIGTRHTAWYSILDGEWPDVRAGLETRLAAHRAD